MEPIFFSFFFIFLFFSLVYFIFVQFNLIWLISVWIWFDLLFVLSIWKSSSSTAAAEASSSSMHYNLIFVFNFFLLLFILYMKGKKLIDVIFDFFTFFFSWHPILCSVLTENIFFSSYFLCCYFCESPIIYAHILGQYLSNILNHRHLLLDFVLVF